MPLVALLSRKGESWLATAPRVRLRWVASCLAVISFLVTQALHWLLFPVDNLDQLMRRMLGDALAAVLIGCLAYRVFRDLAERRRALYERLQLIGELNHHIRNALQVIQLSAMTTQNEQAIHQIDESVQRVSSVLHDLVPMQRTEPKQAA
jgi:signal transduction histidine kinase